MPEKVNLTIVSLVLPSFPMTILPEDSLESLSSVLESQPSVWCCRGLGFRSSLWVLIDILGQSDSFWSN